VWLAGGFAALMFSKPGYGGAFLMALNGFCTIFPHTGGPPHPGKYLVHLVAFYDIIYSIILKHNFSE
jgi:hypothetical protein